MLTKLFILLFSVSCIASTIKVFEIDTGVDGAHLMISPYLNKADMLAHPDNYQDYHGHGTHIAGIIVKDICPQVSLYSCRFYEGKLVNWELYLNCLKRAYDEKMDFINFSGGGETFSQQEFDAFKRLSTIPIVISVAAGNENPDTHKKLNLGNPCFGYWPACLPFTNITVVGNIKQDGTINSSSNYGMPGMVYEMGTSVWSAAPGNRMTYMTGTSQATAKHTNKLLKQKCKELNNGQSK
jgi:subtilisin family serine protease